MLRCLLHSSSIEQPRRAADVAQGGEAGRRAACLPQAAGWRVLVVQSQTVFAAAASQHCGTHAETHHRHVTLHAESHHMTNTPLACIGIRLKASSVWPEQLYISCARLVMGGKGFNRVRDFICERRFKEAL